MFCLIIFHAISILNLHCSPYNHMKYFENEQLYNFFLQCILLVCDRQNLASANFVSNIWISVKRVRRSATDGSASVQFTCALCMGSHMKDVWGRSLSILDPFGRWFFIRIISSVFQKEKMAVNANVSRHIAFYSWGKSRE